LAGQGSLRFRFADLVPTSRIIHASAASPLGESADSASQPASFPQCGNVSILRLLYGWTSFGYAGSNPTRTAGDPMSREQFWFFHPFRVRYSEIDGQGVVFNAHYLTYFDTTITEYFRALGYDQYADAKQTGEDYHVVKSMIEYKAPVRFDQELDVGARVARIGNTSLTFELAIFLKGGADALVTGEIVWVNTNQQTHRPVPVSKEIRERIAAREPHLGA